jgi:hypothetical protein
MSPVLRNTAAMLSQRPKIRLLREVSAAGQDNHRTVDHARQHDLRHLQPMPVGQVEIDDRDTVTTDQQPTRRLRPRMRFARLCVEVVQIQMPQSGEISVILDDQAMHGARLHPILSLFGCTPPIGDETLKQPFCEVTVNGLLHVAVGMGVTGPRDVVGTTSGIKLSVRSFLISWSG